MPGMKIRGGLRWNSGSELKLYIGCTGSTIDHPNTVRNRSPDTLPQHHLLLLLIKLKTREVDKFHYGE